MVQFFSPFRFVGSLDQRSLRLREFLLLVLHVWSQISHNERRTQTTDTIFIVVCFPKKTRPLSLMVLCPPKNKRLASRTTQLSLIISPRRTSRVSPQGERCSGPLSTAIARSAPIFLAIAPTVQILSQTVKTLQGNSTVSGELSVEREPLYIYIMLSAVQHVVPYEYHRGRFEFI